VPMSRRVTRELGQWQKTTRWSGPADLVFAEPASGEVLRRGALMRRYRRALKAAKLEPTHRFHDLRHYADGGVMRPVELFGLVGALPVVILSA
jgi:integrase